MIKQWNEMFEKLKAYKREHGDCLVPQLYDKDKALGVWVMTQRTKMKANILAAERKAKLDSIGFVWESDEQKWNGMFEKLNAYKRNYGDCLVPIEYAEDKQLGYWVVTQCTQRKANRLAAERKAKLDSIGFVWESHEQSWNRMFEKLKIYKQNYGDCLVPKEYDEDKSLGLWVRAQRMQRKANRLEAERKAKLDSIGFVWESHEQSWNKMFEKLKIYKQNHGDCLVPTEYDKDKSLGQWVMMQCMPRKANRLAAERKAKLDSIGFVWESHEQSWNRIVGK